MVATLYRRRKILFASADGRTDQFLPNFFLQKYTNYTCDVTSDVTSWGNSDFFIPLKHVFFPGRGANLATSSKMWVDSCLGRAVYKVPPHMGGSHSALCLDTHLSERDRVQ